ncbi:bacteriohemerythrin [Helicovermis profundi]|uniref:Hemerythrin family protein n=1 Tax=Helicovermis profundi TaxID=3065157 RepID=A0AAU9E2S7_9FIRM|nr:hemerythrin family protein [Clostridia bacterium S502]
MSIKWEEKYSVKIKAIDEQHKILLNLIGELEDFSKKYNYKEVLPETLNTLSEYVKVHFSTEEELMQKVNYPFLKEHKKVHNNFTNEVENEIKKLEKKEVTALDIIFLYNYLLVWIKEHILGEDHKYVDYLKEFHDL